VPYNLLWRSIEDEVVPACAARGVGVLAYSPLMAGLLSGKYSEPEQVPVRGGDLPDLCPSVWPPFDWESPL
jgi:aryl-alcohol dehydrogenase-like predicted oxidoreductase